MQFIACFLVLALFAHVQPKLTSYLVIVPVIGTTCGAFAWSLAAITFSSLITPAAFVSFIALGIIIALMFAKT